ncbi:CENPB protein Homeodomainlike, partial [Phytophthora megakarya]
RPSASAVRRIRYKQPTNNCSADSTATHRRRVKFPELEQQLVSPAVEVRPARYSLQDVTCHYRPDNIKRKLNVFEAIKFSIDSWGDVSAECIRNCWVKARIVNAEVMVELRQAGNYSVTAEQKVIDDLANMLEGISVSEYLGVDADIEVHEFPENGINQHIAAVSDDEDDPVENESPPVSASTALAYCMEFSYFFFQCEGDTKRE